MVLNSKKILIFILVFLIVIVYSFDFYFFFFYKKSDMVLETFKKEKEQIYITEDFFKGNEPRILGTGYYQDAIGSLLFYKSSYNDNLIRIIIGEQNELTDLTYKSILSLIKFIHSDEYDDFVKKFDTLKDLGYKRYQITLNPTLDEIEKGYLNSYSDYQFVLIEILRNF